MVMRLLVAGAGLTLWGFRRGRPRDPSARRRVQPAVPGAGGRLACPAAAALSDREMLADFAVLRELAQARGHSACVDEYGPSILAPFRQAALQSARVEPVAAHGGHGLMRVDAVGSAAIGDDLRVRRERGEDLLQLRQGRVTRAGDVAR